MQNKETISVIIPTYNRGKDLVRAIHSVLSQTYPVTEILICDDGSSDDSRTLVNSLNNSKIKWLDCGKNGGPAVPRNIGIKNSKGNWIAFLDSDDWWEDTKIEMQINIIRQHNANAVCSNASRIVAGKNNGSYLQDVKEVISVVDLMYVNHVICSSVLISKNILLQTSLFPEDKKFIAIEDHALWICVGKLTDFIFINEPLVNYSDSPGNSIRTHYTDSYDVFAMVFLNFKSWIKQKKLRLSYNERKELRMWQKRIKNKGTSTKWDLIVRKIKSKFRWSKIS